MNQTSLERLSEIRTIQFDIPNDPIKGVIKWAEFGWEFERLTGEVHQQAFHLGLNIQGNPEIGWRIERFDLASGIVGEELACVRYFHEVITWIFQHRCQ